MRKTKIYFCFPFFILCAKKKNRKNVLFTRKYIKWRSTSIFRFSFYAQELTSGHLLSPFCMDKWGVVQSVGQYTIGVWIKYSTSDAYVDRIRQPIYNLGASSIRNNTWPMTGWLSCCSTETSRNKENYFTIIVRTWAGNGVVYVFATL